MGKTGRGPTLQLTTNWLKTGVGLEQQQKSLANTKTAWSLCRVPFQRRHASVVLQSLITPSFCVVLTCCVVPTAQSFDCYNGPSSTLQRSARPTIGKEYTHFQHAGGLAQPAGPRRSRLDRRLLLL